MKKNQLTTTTSTALILGKSKSLMGITKRLLESKRKGLAKAKASQGLTPYKDITIIGDLMWEKETEDKMAWKDAIEYAKKLRLGGYDDWRLPTIEELGEVVTLCGGEFVRDDDNAIEKIDRNKENALYQKAYKVKGFAVYDYWSSTTDADNSDYAWIIWFSYGSQNYFNKDTNFRVRCVRTRQ